MNISVKSFYLLRHRFPAWDLVLGVQLPHEFSEPNAVHDANGAQISGTHCRQFSVDGLVLALSQGLTTFLPSHQRRLAHQALSRFLCPINVLLVSQMVFHSRRAPGVLQLWLTKHTFRLFFCHQWVKSNPRSESAWKTCLQFKVNDSNDARKRIKITRRLSRDSSNTQTIGRPVICMKSKTAKQKFPSAPRIHGGDARLPRSFKYGIPFLTYCITWFRVVFGAVSGSGIGVDLDASQRRSEDIGLRYPRHNSDNKK